jgi:hypothetical protein
LQRRAVRRYLKPFRLPGASRSHPDPHRRNPAPTAPAVAKPRTISRAPLTHPDRLSQDDALIVKNAAAGCAHLETPPAAHPLFRQDHGPAARDRNARLAGSRRS